MAKKQANKGKVVKSDEQIQIERSDAKIAEMKGFAEAIIRSQNTISNTNVDELQSNVESYRRLSETLANDKDLIATQKSQAKAIREKFNKDVLPGLNGKIAGVIKAREEAQNKLKAAQEKQAAEAKAAVKAVRGLLPNLESVANRFLNAKLADRDYLFKSFKEIQSQLNEYTAKGILPEKARLNTLMKMDELSRQVNQKVDEIEQYLQSTRATVDRAVSKAKEIVANMTIMQLFMSIMPHATRVELLKILGQEQIKAITNRDNPDAIGALIISDLPKSVQSALISLIFNEIVLKNESGLVPSFLKSIQNQIGGLISGEKQFLTVAARRGNEIILTHIDILSLLENSDETLSDIILALHAQGVGEDDIVMLLTSKDEVEALLHVQGFDMNLLRGDALGKFIELLIEGEQYTEAQAGALIKTDGKTSELLRNSDTLRAFIEFVVNNDLNALTPVFGKLTLSQENRAVIEQFRKEQKNNPVQGLTLPQITKLLEFVVQARITQKLLLGQPVHEDVVELTNIEDVAVEQGEQLELTHVSSAADEITPADVEDITPPIMPEVDKPKKLDLTQNRWGDYSSDHVDKIKPELDLTKEKQGFEALMGQLNQIQNHLVFEGRDNDRYVAAFLNLRDTITNLQKSGDTLFRSPNSDTLQAFKECVDTSFKATEKELSNHRGWHSINAVFKGFLGVIAALAALIPALIVQATVKEGYVGTFFATPKTTSSKMFESVKSNSAALQEGLSKKIDDKPEDGEGYTGPTKK